MQEQPVELRFHVDRIRGSNPDTRSVARLAPHAYRRKAVGGTLLPQHPEHLPERIKRCPNPLELRLRQPAKQLAVAKPSPHRRQEHDGGRIVTGQRHAFGSDLAVRYDCAGTENGNGIGF
jgi:hypothetical protein